LAVFFFFSSLKHTLDEKRAGAREENPYCFCNGEQSFFLNLPDHGSYTPRDPKKMEEALNKLKRNQEKMTQKDFKEKLKDLGMTQPSLVSN